MKTAVEWLHELSKQRELDKFDWQQAKQMEKEQIINFGQEIVDDIAYDSQDKEYVADKYNETIESYE